MVSFFGTRRRVIVHVRGGKVNIDFDGFRGRECDIEHDRLREALQRRGVREEEEEREYKEEYYQEEEQQLQHEYEFGF